MKTKEFKELKTKEVKELRGLVKAKKLELTQTMGRIYAGREKNLKKGKVIRRDIAQIMTVLSSSKKVTIKKGKE